MVKLYKDNLCIHDDLGANKCFDISIELERSAIFMPSGSLTFKINSDNDYYNAFSGRMPNCKIYAENDDGVGGYCGRITNISKPEKGDPNKTITITCDRIFAYLK